MAIIKIWQLSLPALEIDESHFIQFPLFGQQKSLGFSSFGRTPPYLLCCFLSIYASSPIRRSTSDAGEEIHQVHEFKDMPSDIGNTSFLEVLHLETSLHYVR